MKNYAPVPVSIAKHIAQTFAKSQVVIIAVDPVHECTHHTTYGVSAQDKIDSSALSERINDMLTGGLKMKTFEDYRAIPAAVAKERIDKLESIADKLAAAIDKCLRMTAESDRLNAYARMQSGLDDAMTEYQSLKQVNELLPP